MKITKYTDVNPSTSITDKSVDSTPGDYNQPYSFNDWLSHTGRVGGNPDSLKADYKKYLGNWSVSRDTTLQDTSYKHQYITYLKQLTYNYVFTQDEKRIVNTVDYNNPFEVDTVTYIWSKRIKQVCEYIRNQREELKFQPTKVQQRCTTGGVENIILNDILRFIKDEDTRQEYVNNLEEVDRIKDELRVELTELYDLEEGYYNNNQLDSEFLQSSQGMLAEKYNRITFDPWIFIDRNRAIQNIIESYNVTTNLSIEDDQLLTLPLSLNNITVEDLPPNEFIEYATGLEQLTIDTVKQLITNSIGVDLYYAQTNESAEIINQGLLVKATNSTGNILNRRNPSINIVNNNNTQVKTVQQIGGFFTPDKMGLLSYASLSPVFKVKTDQLEPDTLYVYNDPEVYASNSEEYTATTAKPLPIEFFEQSTWFKSTKVDDDSSGDIIDTGSLPKFYNYASDTEVNQHSKYGLSRFDDSFDFWSGEQSDIWSNSDIFEVSEIKNLPLQERQDALMINSGQIHKWRSDVYGNEYALYKNIIPTNNSGQEIQPECLKDKYLNEILCEVIDGADLIDILTGSPVYEQCIDGGTDQPTLDISENLEYLNLAENVTGKTWKCNNVECTPGSRFVSVGVLQGAIESGFSPKCDFTTFINGSYFLPDICGDDTLETSQLPSCRIIDGYSVEVPSRYNELDYYELSGTWHGTFKGQSGDFFSVPYDDLWDAGSFDYQCAVNFDISYKQNFSTKYITSDDLKGTTVSQDNIQEDTSVKTIAQTNYNVGELMVRDSSSRYVENFSSILSSFVSTIPEVSVIEGKEFKPREQLINYITDFDVINDIIILYSDNFIYMNKIQYDYDTGYIVPDYSSGLLIGYNKDNTIPVKHFYNEKTQEIIVGTMKYSDKDVTGELYSLFYPAAMYRISTTSDSLQPQRLNFTKEEYILQGTILQVDLSDIGHITFNEQLNYYYITCGGILQDFDAGEQFYVYQTRFTLDKDIPTAVTSQRPRIYTSAALQSSIEETGGDGITNRLETDDNGLGYYDLSTYLNDSFMQNGFDYDSTSLLEDQENENWINNRLLKPSSDDHNVGNLPTKPTFTPVFPPDSVQTFYFKLNIDSYFTLENSQSTVYKVEARFARPDISPDHIDTVVATRTPLPDWSRLDMTRLANKDDLTDPRQHILTYEYNFQSSPEQCLENTSVENCTSTTQWDDITSPYTPKTIPGRLYKFVIILHTMDGEKLFYPYKFVLNSFNAGNCLNDIKIINVSSYVDTDYHESSLIILESQFPRFVAPIVLRTEALEKITFNSAGLKTETNTISRSEVYTKQETVTNILNNV